MQYNLIDAAVHTCDGEAGRVWRIAMDPNTRQITHLVVHKGLLGRNVVVPVPAISHMSPGHVYLNVTTEELKGLPDFQTTEFLAPEENWDYPLGYPPGGVVWPMSLAWIGASPYPYLSNAVLKENIPEQDVTLAAGTDVACTDGHCGRIERVLYDDASHEMTGFVIKKGFLFTRDVKAPMSWIDHLEHDRVLLKLSRHQVEEMAEYFED